ncbi:MAG: energy-coupling factor transporter ATPase [Clostridiales bacterium]|nr:energy-coupling factor transporter ATPase [Clostridiales bacterium]
MEKIIEIKNVSYGYKTEDGATEAISGVTLDIKKGSFVVFLGHNGSGKSTLAKLCNGFLLPDSGDVLVNGINTKEEKHIYQIRSTVGLVFQNPDNQMVASIIEDDIAFGPENLGVPRQEIIERVDWALDVVGMSSYRTHTPFKLSGGQKQRIAIAGILAMHPSVLILDESTAMLDPKGRKEVLETIKRLNKEQKITVILITHYMDEALDADKVVVLNEGKVLLSGTPREIFSKKEIIKKTKLELPIATYVSSKLVGNGLNVPLSLTDNELVEGICQLR